MTRTKAICWVLLGLHATGCESLEADGEAVGVAKASAPLSAAGVELVARGQISSALHDQSSDTAAPLENGLAGNLLGGIGS